jgi:hypothetical protein
VRVALTISSAERVDVTGEPIERTLIHVVSLRNRNS